MPNACPSVCSTSLKLLVARASRLCCCCSYKSSHNTARVCVYLHARRRAQAAVAILLRSVCAFVCVFVCVHACLRLCFGHQAGRATNLLPATSWLPTPCSLSRLHALACRYAGQQRWRWQRRRRRWRQRTRVLGFNCNHGDQQYTRNSFGIPQASAHAHTLLSSGRLQSPPPPLLLLRLPLREHREAHNTSCNKVSLHSV